MSELSRRAGEPMTVDTAKDIVFGHEFVAELIDHGPNTPGRLKAGTRVVSVPIALGPQGFEGVGYSNRFPGGYGEAMILTEALLLEVPGGLSDTQAAMTEPFAVGEHAVAMSRAAKDTVNLVVGCGPVGLAVIAALKARGLGPIVAADFSPARRAIAATLGADVVIDPATESPHTRWSDLGVPRTRGEASIMQMSGAETKRAVVFECVGVPGVLQSLIEQVPAGTQILVAGVCMETDRIEPFLCISKQIDLQFVLGYTPEEFAGTLTRIADGTIDVLPLVTSEVGLAGVPDAFKALGDPERECKIMVRPA
jgi:threonine dehydrogenase-like Zn-dependent dehydrogenase